MRPRRARTEVGFRRGSSADKRSSGVQILERAAERLIGVGEKSEKLSAEELPEPGELPTATRRVG